MCYKYGIIFLLFFLVFTEFGVSVPLFGENGQRTPKLIKYRFSWTLARVGDTKGQYLTTFLIGPETL